MKLVSLVPSLTESALALGLPPESLVGRTSWCIHPSDQLTQVPSMGGTKTPNLKRIASLKPDLVLLEKEENPIEVYNWLKREGIETWVAHVTQVEDVPQMLRSLGTAIGCETEGHTMASRIIDVLAVAETRYAEAQARPRAVPLIWHDPLMSLAPSRYGGDLVRRCGFDVLDLVEGEGYPKVSHQLLGEARAEHLLLTSEPHRFTAAEAVEISEAIEAAGFAAPRCHLVDGEALTWFGTRTLSALNWWMGFRESLAV